MYHPEYQTLEATGLFNNSRSEETLKIASVISEYLKKIASTNTNRLATLEHASSLIQLFSAQAQDFMLYPSGVIKAYGFNVTYNDNDQ